MKAAGSVPRRSFVSRFAGGLGLGAVALATSPVEAHPPFVPARHKEDDWLDALGTKHRFVFDTTATQGFTDAMVFANNFLTASQSGYGLTDADHGVVIIARHQSTAFAYSDAIWAKYGKTLAGFAHAPEYAGAAPGSNPFSLTGTNLPTRGVTVASLMGRGVHFAVCGMATRFLAGQIAQAAGSSADAVFAELSAGLVANAHLMAAGIVAVNRAQERGYALATAG